MVCVCTCGFVGCVCVYVWVVYMSLSGANMQPKWGVEEWKFDLGRIHAYQRSKWDAFSKGYNWQTQLGQATGSVPNLLPSNG